MKILYIVTAFDRYPGDVITPWLGETIRRLRPHGIDVEVLAPSYRGLPSGLAGDIYVHRFRYAPHAWETLTHDQTAPDRVREKPWYLALVPGYVLAGSRAARRLARSGAFDAIHVHWPIPHALMGLAARRAASIPLVSTFHGVELTWAGTQLRVLAPLMRYIINSSQVVTANSTYTAGMIKNLVPDATVVRIPFGSTVAAPAATTSGRARSGDEPFEILFAGRLVERKGVEYLLDALTRTRARVRLRVIGDGPLLEALQARSTELGLAGRVEFSGFVPAEELARAFRECDAFVLPAVVDSKGDTEGLGVVLIEARQHGKPVIASAAGGIVDIVRDGETGLLVPPADPDALAAAIDRLAADPDLAVRLAEAGKAHVEREFGWDGIIERLVGVYRGLTAGAGS